MLEEVGWISACGRKSPFRPKIPKIQRRRAKSRAARYGCLIQCRCRSEDGLGNCCSDVPSSRLGLPGAPARLELAKVTFFDSSLGAIRCGFAFCFPSNLAKDDPKLTVSSAAFWAAFGSAFPATAAPRFFLAFLERLFLAAVLTVPFEGVLARLGFAAKSLGTCRFGFKDEGRRLADCFAKNFDTSSIVGSTLGPIDGAACALLRSDSAVAANGFIRGGTTLDSSRRFFSADLTVAVNLGFLASSCGPIFTARSS